jgi:hypothetical protein
MTTNSKAQKLHTSSSPPNQAKPDLDSLHKKFHNLILLLHLLTTINRGFAILPAEDSPHVQDLPIGRKIIDAVTSILVHNREVLAATA